MNKLFLRTGHNKDMYFACQKITGNPSNMMLKKDGYMIVKIFYNMYNTLAYIEDQNTLRTE